MFEKNNRTLDPQITVNGTIKETQTGEMIVFTIPLGFFELVCLANIPADGEKNAPVYVKFKVNPGQVVSNATQTFMNLLMAPRPTRIIRNRDDQEKDESGEPVVHYTRMAGNDKSR